MPRDMYRILLDKCSGYYKVQVKRWWSPVFLQLGGQIVGEPYSFNDMGEARRFIERKKKEKRRRKEKKKEIIEYIDETYIDD